MYKLHTATVMLQGDSADSMLSWVVEQQGPDAMKDPNLAKQVTLAVLRQAIPNPKVPCPPGLPVPGHAACMVIVADMSCDLSAACV